MAQVPAQRTANDARLSPQPGDKQHAPDGDTWTVVSVTDGTVTLRTSEGAVHPIPLGSWARVVPGFRWEPAPAAAAKPAPVGDACTPGREVPPPKRTPREARFNPQPGDRQLTAFGNTWVVVTVDGGHLTVDVYGALTDGAPWRGGMTTEYWARAPSPGFRWEPGPGAGAYGGPECGGYGGSFRPGPCAGGPGVPCGAA